MPSKIFGPTDSVADTLTIVGSAYTILPQDNAKQTGNIGWTIYNIRAGKGNVVVDKGNTGHIVVETTERSYFFAFGNGHGAQVDGIGNQPAENIPTHIFVPFNTQVIVRVLDENVAKDVIVCLQFKPAINNMSVRTLAAGGASGSGDTAADTEESVTVSTKLTRASLTPEFNGKIKRIRFVAAGVTDAKAATGKLILIIPGVGEPYEYAVGNGCGGQSAAAGGGTFHADVIDIPEGVPVKGNVAVDVKLTSAEAMVKPCVSLEYEPA